MKFYNKKYLINLVFLGICTSAIIQTEVASNYEQEIELIECHQQLEFNNLQNESSEFTGSFFIKLLAEFRELKQAPDNFYTTDIFTADILLKTAENFVEAMKERLSIPKQPEELWVGGGTKDYLFVRKLIIPQDSVIEFRGDLHGDVHSLIRWIDGLAQEGWFEKENPFKLTKESVKKHRYLAFLGDYTDRGHYGAEIMVIIMQLFLHNPDNILIVRGNHEDININSDYGFVEELKEKFSLNYDQIEEFAKMYEYLPVAMFLGCKNDTTKGVDFIQCCHGGMEFGYNSHRLLSDKDNEKLDVYEWLDENLEEKRGDIAVLRHADMKNLAKCVCGKNNRMKNNGFQWNDFDFMNESPFSLPKLNQGRGFILHQKYTTRLLEDATEKNAKNKVLAVFRAHQHSPTTVQHILDYGNGIYKLWNNTGSKSEIKAGYKQFKQWTGKENEAVPFETYSVWTFNVAPRTSAYEKIIRKPHSFNYDTVARLVLKSGFDNWELYPRKIPVKSEKLKGRIVQNH